MRKVIFYLFTQILLLLLICGIVNAQTGLVILGDTYTEAEGELVKATIIAAGYKCDVVKINADVNNRGWADGISASTIDFTKYALVYFAWNAPGHDGAYFMKGAEANFRKWVENGGIVIMDAFDDNFKDDQGNQVGLWFPIDKYPAKILNTADSDVEVTQAGKDLGIFDAPNKVDLNALVLDDNFAETNDPAYEILGTRKDGNGAFAFQLKYGKGYYIYTCVDTRDATRLASAKPLIENLLTYAAKLLVLGASSVDSHNCITTKWGEIKR